MPGRAGVKSIDAKLDLLAGETNERNNRLTRVLAVDDTKRRILYVEGEPRWEYKFLRRAVEDDPALADRLDASYHAEQDLSSGNCEPK